MRKWPFFRCASDPWPFHEPHIFHASPQSTNHPPVFAAWFPTFKESSFAELPGCEVWTSTIASVKAIDPAKGRSVCMIYEPWSGETLGWGRHKGQDRQVGSADRVSGVSLFKYVWIVLGAEWWSHGRIHGPRLTILFPEWLLRKTMNQSSRTINWAWLSQLWIEHGSEIIFWIDPLAPGWKCMLGAIFRRFSIECLSIESLKLWGSKFCALQTVQLCYPES